MAGKQPSGTMPHAFDKQIETEVPRIVLVDTFLDEPQDALRVAERVEDCFRTKFLMP